MAMIRQELERQHRPRTQAAPLPADYEQDRIVREGDADSNMGVDDSCGGFGDFADDAIEVSRFAF